MLELKDVCAKEKDQSVQVNAPQQYKESTPTFSVKIFSANMQSQQFSKNAKLNGVSSEL